MRGKDILFHIYIKIAEEKMNVPLQRGYFSFSWLTKKKIIIF